MTVERLPDQEDRNRFITESERNFSVLAPAGVGKTRAIVDRVVNIATAQTERRDLPNLVVVTYTNKAADEMQQRARTALLAHPNGASLMGEFNRAFFGTIHSFCLNVLRTYGHYLGLPGDLDMANDQDEDRLWVEFFRSFALSDLETGLTDDQLRTCFRHLPLQDVVELARHVVSGTAAHRLSACPVPDFEAVLAFVPKSQTRKNVELAQERLSQWKKAYESNTEFLPLPEFSKGGADFQATWRQAFAPLREWLGHCSSAVAVAVAGEYAQFRIRSGRLTYADQITFVLELLKHPAAGPKLRGLGYRIILDEAQDTDRDQFRVLLEMARPTDAKGVWIDRGGVPPVPGRFCMVGDPQQSIYGKRADLTFYHTVREKLHEAGADELKFHVTFRCAKTIISTANALCPTMLNDEDGQVEYVNLKPRPGAAEGQVVRCQVSGSRDQRTEVRDQTLGTSDQKPTANAQPSTDDKLSVNELARMEAGQIAAWIKEQGLAKLGARDWSEVAILCARKRWIDPLEMALQELDLPVQNHSLRAARIDDPAFAWFVALMVCVAEPRNSFEIVGILREVFGLSDQQLYDFVQAGLPLQIEARTEATGPVAETLNLLHDTRLAALRLPMLDAARHVMDTTKLGDRLAAISSDDGAASTMALDVLLSRAAAAESDGLSFADWAEVLKQSAEDPLESPPARKDAIQLITCHAAKGLEWDTVILPFLFRPLSTAANQYPYVYEDRRSRKSTMVLGKDWLDEDDGERIKRSIAQENQRLLYVAMTRARNTLVLTDDQPLFGWKKESFAGCFAGSRLGEDASPHPEHGRANPPGEPHPAKAQKKKDPSGVFVMPDAWNRMGSTLSEMPGSVPTTTPTPGGQQKAPAPILTATLTSAGKRAAVFPSRILPYSLARHVFDAEPEQDRNRDPEWESAAGETAKRYGTWWHGLMEKLDWKQKSSWPPLFEAELVHSPIPERAKREWPLFLKSDIANTLASSSFFVQVEVPFLRPRPDGNCVEGFIDLVACDSERENWIVLDWKTNEIENAKLAELWQIYEPQVAEYVETVRLAAGPKATITACLYSTCCGKTVTG